MVWGSGALNLNDEILNLIGKDKIRRRRARLFLLKQKNSGIVSREILWKLMNSVLADDFHIHEANREIEKVFNFHRRNIPDHGIVCRLSNGIQINSVGEITFKKFRKFTTADQKKTALWVRDGAKQRIRAAHGIVEHSGSHQ
jgi:hypothetical protein